MMYGAKSTGGKNIARYCFGIVATEGGYYCLGGSRFFFVGGVDLGFKCLQKL